MRRTATVALVALAGLATIPARALADTPASAESIRPAALTPSVPRGATRLGGLPPAKPLTIEVVLEPSNSAVLDALITAQSDPASPSYEHWLTPAQFAEAFGPNAASVDATTTWLHGKGLSATSVQGSVVRATGTAQAVADALGVSFSSYELASGATGYAAASAPLVPRALAGEITTIIGLSDTVRFDNRLELPPSTLAGGTRATPRPLARAVPHAAPKACANARNYAGSQFWTPDQVAAIYGVNDLVAQGQRGQGKTIGLLELAPSRPSDTQHFLSCFGLHNRVTVTNVDGGATPDEFGTLEADIDIQEAAAHAPGAAIRSYEAPNDGIGEFDAYNRMIHDNIAVISTSWGRCELALDDAPGFIDGIHNLFRQAAAQGQSIFAASGDKGSEDCYDPADSSPNTTLQVDNPADDPLVTGVGGTALRAPGHEPVWNDCEGETSGACAAVNGDATGGGQSKHFKRPSWQPVSADATCTTCRQVPDVAANAGVPETFYDSDFPAGADPGPDSWVAVGGTSIAAPKLVGIVADIASACTSGRLGDFAPKLAALSAKNVYGTALTDVKTGFDASGAVAHVVTPGDNDLTRNNSRKFKATTGFDLTTGFGTPLARGLSCPQITSLSPGRGKAGTHVTVHGLGLERATIKFGSVKAQVLSSSATSATVVAPAAKGAVSVSGSDPIGTGTHHALFEYPGADTGAYRTVAADGGVFTFGGAKFYGSPAGSTTAPIVGMAVDHATGGYWLASADGNVYAFNAPNLGSTRGTHLNQPIVGIAATTSGGGYWLVARDGGIFAFGNAKFHGSTGGMHLNQPIVGIATDEHSGGCGIL